MFDINLQNLVTGLNNKPSESPSTQVPSQVSLLKRATVMILAVSASALGHAKLPVPLETALATANIAADNISVIIEPVHASIGNQQTTSTLAKLMQQQAGSEVNNAQINPSNNTSSTNSASHTPLTQPIRHLADVPRNPASTLKLIPTFVALDILGPDFVWFTKVYHTGHVSAGTLYGDLIIEGGADPKLTQQNLAQLLQQVKDQGIHHIRGNIIIDSALFQQVTKDPAAFDNDPLRPYNVSPDGLLLNFNSLHIKVHPLHNNDAPPRSAKLYYQPMLADYQLPKSIAISSSGDCGSIRTALAPKWQADKLVFSHPLPQSCHAQDFYLAYPDVKDFATRAIKYQWLNPDHILTGQPKFLALGNTLSGTVINTDSLRKTKYGSYTSTSETLTLIPASPIALVSYPSAPLSQQIHDINHYSNNVMTEQLTLTLPLYTDSTTLKSHSAIDNPAIKTKQNSHSNYDQALALIDHWWQQNLQTPAPIMSNGSGLCRDCFVTADNLAELLTFAYHHPSFEVYGNSLRSKPIFISNAARSSEAATANVETSTSANNSANKGAKTEHTKSATAQSWIKTGTLRHVSSIAGYVHGQSGQDYVVVAIISNPNTAALDIHQAREVLDTLISWTAQH